MADLPTYPPTLIYGTDRPNVRLRWHGGTQTYFCTVNHNLHLTPKSFDETGTYPSGWFLGKLCHEHCRPERKWSDPCPAFVADYERDQGGLTQVQLRETPEWEACPGVQRVLSMNREEEERFFWLTYLTASFDAEASLRERLIDSWNAGWHLLPFHSSWTLDASIWRTIPAPALTPQVWLNWLFGASEEDLARLEEGAASRVDYVAFARGERHVIEIDGPSHYAHWDGRSLKVDERAYARNLKIDRYLRGEGWIITRLARIEVRDCIEAGAVERSNDAADDAGYDTWRLTRALLSVLPFYPWSRVPPLTASDLGVAALEQMPAWSDPSYDDIPF